ncbi:MAG: hypothetical protein F6J87_14325 [Spirulina sp. SIO3F2]|nr:hypothetical protein [Spirulina sp. SIO3F2]
MAAWIVIYLQKAPELLTAQTICKNIESADWWTLGEDFGLEENAVNDFMETIQWSNEPLSFGQEGQRPVQFHLWTERERILEEIWELPASTPPLIQQHLEHIQAIVALEIRISQLRTMFEVVAFESAYWLAETYVGIIQADDGQWYDYDEHRWQPISS